MTRGVVGLGYCDMSVSRRGMVKPCRQTHLGTVQDQGQQDRLERAMENLRKQHQWGDLTDQAYRREREPLVRQLNLVARPEMLPPQLPNLERERGLRWQYLPEFCRSWDSRSSTFPPFRTASP